ncbi:inactive dipeptidyl peptidase 10 [Austrofundulus limnaeus]|uniref:Inactive dipeptidyl peptidase 10 n=1 Tax=Austrofundulus limnaeus TaxID=52670 RepID=A0A2I4CNH5_AUSLI|nr:PREDICTED: inactive dipeptidyl peptidase 10-like [Austrofundulus limnaeus]
MNQSAGAAQHSRRFSVEEKDVGHIGADRNWKGIGISLLVIVVVLSFIGLSIVLLSRESSGNPFSSQLTLDDLLDRTFQIHDPGATWISASEVVFRSWDGDVFKVNTLNYEMDLLIKNTTFATFKATKFAVSPDQNFVLLGYDVKRVYKHSFLASYLIYNLYTREVRELNPPEVSDSVLQFASWGVQGQQLIYIFENNIYYQTDVQSSSWRLTSSGQEGVVFNGISDWLYEEEVLHTQVAHWWSPDGSRLAYLTINDSLVPNMILPRFTGSLYPKGKEYPYPKMGQVNPTVGLHVISLDGSSVTTELKPPESFKKSDYYVTMVRWATPERLGVRWVNRAQNVSILSLCDTDTGICVKKHVMTSDRWLNHQNEEPVFSRDCRTFFITLPLKDGRHGAFSHITMISNQSEGPEVTLRHLTSGNWDVSHILAFDEQIRSVYFLSSEEGSTQRHLYSVSAEDPFHKKCLSCSLFKPNCSFYNAVISPDCRHVLLTCTGPGIPQTSLHQLKMMRGEFFLRPASEHKVLDRNAELRRALMNRTVPKTERRTLQIHNLGFRLELIVPVDLDETKEHPLLLVLDSAPGGQAVSDRFSLDWDSVLVSSDRAIVARLDGRGSGFQGQRIQHGLHQKVGVVDVQDQMSAVEHLVELPFVDRTRVGVYGKAYGGFLSTLLLLSHSSMFQCGVAVAPITNWRLYGSTCSEKYFGFPTKDQKFEVFSLVNNASARSATDFLLLHGTADASVHFQHSAELINLLNVLSVNYTLQMFPDEGHVVSADSRRYELRSVLNFLGRCFFQAEQPPPPETSKEEE